MFYALYIQPDSLRVKKPFSLILRLPSHRFISPPLYAARQRMLRSLNCRRHRKIPKTDALGVLDQQPEIGRSPLPYSMSFYHMLVGVLFKKNDMLPFLLRLLQCSLQKELYCIQNSSGTRTIEKWQVQARGWVWDYNAAIQMVSLVEQQTPPTLLPLPPASLPTIKLKLCNI